jgi:hypothetical protein
MGEGEGGGGGGLWVYISNRVVFDQNILAGQWAHIYVF